MNKSMSAFVSLAVALAMLGSPAIAETSPKVSHQHRSHKAIAGKHYRHRNHDRHHSYVHRIYGRPGPLYGYRFGFSTYPGDPFYSDDYFDGRSCYYLHHRDFCRGPKSLDWLRW
jgi:hypothetical protein